MSYLPLRFGPGADLRGSLDAHAFPDGSRSGFVVAGLGSLLSPRLRFAAAEEEVVIGGPVELLSISGSLSENGAHVHVTVSTAQGQVFGGHLCYGSEVRTTVELLLAQVQGARLSRTHDIATGYKELEIRLVSPAQPSDA